MPALPGENLLTTLYVCTINSGDHPTDQWQFRRCPLLFQRPIVKAASPPLFERQLHICLSQFYPRPSEA
jgi:hypothetical protein